MGIPLNGPPRENVMWDYGGSMPSYIFSFMTMLEGLAYKVGGYTDVMQGVVPDYASGQAIARATQSAGVRIRKGVKHLGYYYQRKYRRYIKMLKDVDPRQIMRTLGDDEEMTQQAFMNIDWDAIEDIRIEVRNVLGTFREEQYAKLEKLIAGNPNLAPVILPAMADLIDVAIDTDKLDREQMLQNALAQAHDEIAKIREEIKK